jgi:hypothetical protein
MPIMNKGEVTETGTPSEDSNGTGAPQWGALLRSPYTLLCAVYFVSRVVYYQLGVRFDSGGLSGYLQFIDEELLRHNLLQSLFYLHWQPPGYNLFLGIFIKLFPTTYGAALHAVHLVFGASIMCCVYYCMRSLKAGALLSFVITSVFIVSPGIVLFENFVFYEYQLAFLLVVSAALLFHSFKHRSKVSAIGFLLCQFWVVIVRNQYHLVYFVAVFLLLVYFTKHNRKLVSIAGSVLLALILSLFFKNLVLFGKFASSTWIEMGMGPLLLYQMTPQERDPLLAQGKLSGAWYAEINAPYFLNGVCIGGIPISSFKPYITMPPKTGIPILDQEFKSSGYVNYNHRGYLEAQKLYVNDLKCIMRECPKAYLRSVAIAWYTYFLPAGDFPFFTRNLPHIKKIERFFDSFLLGQFKYTEIRRSLREMYSNGEYFSILFHTGFFLVIGLPMLFLFGLLFLYRRVRQRTLDLPQALLMGFILFNIFYGTATANFLSSYENNRYRFPMDGLFLVLFALAVDQLIRKIADMRRRRQSMQSK